MATAVMRIADGIPTLGLSVRARASRTDSAEVAMDGLPDLGLSLMLDPPQARGAQAATAEALAATTGAVIFDGALIDSLIEVQTIGRIDGAARPPRRPTRIDAALVQPFAQDLIDQTAGLLPRDHWGPRPGRVRAGTYLAGTGSLPVVLTAPAFLRVSIDLTLADGARQSTITLLLPDGTGPAEGADETKLVLHDPEWAARMAAVGRTAPVRLEAVLPPVRMTLAELVALQPGDLIDVDVRALQDLRLLSGSLGVGAAGRQRMPHGLRIGARLGQLDGARAVRILNSPNDPAGADPIRMQELSGPSGNAAVSDRSGRPPESGPVPPGVPALAGPATGTASGLSGAAPPEPGQRAR